MSTKKKPNNKTATQKKSLKIQKNEKNIEDENEDAEEIIEILNSIPEDERKHVISKIEQSVSYSGPIPHYTSFAGYEKVLPGSADRILQMSEEQSKHRQSIEKAVVASGISDSKRGQWFGFCLGIVGLIGGFFLIYSDKQAAGVSTLIGTVATLVGVFVYGKRSEKQELKGKQI